MEKAKGIELGRVWESLKPRDKLSITKQIGSITSTLSRARFPFHGSLYRCQDVSESGSIKIDDTVAIGPTTGRAWFDDRRGEVDVHRGPCKVYHLSNYVLVRLMPSPTRVTYGEHHEGAGSAGTSLSE
jgi:hypothetical protein